MNPSTMNEVRTIQELSSNPDNKNFPAAYDGKGQSWTFWHGEWCRTEDIGDPTIGTKEKPNWIGV